MSRTAMRVRQKMQGADRFCTLWWLQSNASPLPPGRDMRFWSAIQWLQHDKEGAQNGDNTVLEGAVGCFV